MAYFLVNFQISYRFSMYIQRILNSMLADLNINRLHPSGFHVSYEDSTIYFEQWPLQNIKVKTTFSTYPIFFVYNNLDNYTNNTWIESTLTKERWSMILGHIDRLHSPFHVLLFVFAAVSYTHLTLPTIYSV
eukprot:TRINITY_DN25983_c0_g1_i1.p1 TRINITY_DN25983_c0_g1~~TRINITY_DN25983_c0_g1_i1.p1  ORF type:complete len:132 (+),score=1.41 TRINITY_DN25983_c0_g1_i1:116-511(+)